MGVKDLGAILEPAGRDERVCVPRHQAALMGCVVMCEWRYDCSVNGDQAVLIGWA